MEQQEKTIYNTTLVLYAERDERFKTDIVNHLNLKSTVTPLGSILPKCLEESHALNSHIRQTIQSTTSVICLLSYDFIMTDFGVGNSFSKLIEAHNLNRICLIPIFIDRCHSAPTKLKSIWRLSYNPVPLIELEDKEYHENLQLLCKEVAAMITLANKYNNDLTELWENAQSSDELEQYRFFIQKYPYSRYTNKAKERYKKLLEDKLWKESSAMDSTQNYLYYLVNAPYAINKEDSVEKIIEFEESEEIARQDIMMNSNLALLLDYKLRYRESGDLNLVNEKIHQILSKPIDQWMPEDENIVTESHFLKYKIYDACNKNEIFNYYLIEKSYEKVIRKLQRVKSSLNSKIGSLSLFMGMLIFGTLFLFILPENGMLSSLHSYRYFFVFLCVIVGFSVWNAVAQLKSEVDFCKDNLVSIKKKFVELKVLFSSRNTLGQGKLFLFLFNTEEWLHALSNRSIWFYLLAESSDIDMETIKMDEEVKSIASTI